MRRSWAHVYQPPLCIRRGVFMLHPHLTSIAHRTPLRQTSSASQVRRNHVQCDPPRVHCGFTAPTRNLIHRKHIHPTHSRHSLGRAVDVMQGRNSRQTHRLVSCHMGTHDDYTIIFTPASHLFDISVLVLSAFHDTSIVMRQILVVHVTTSQLPGCPWPSDHMHHRYNTRGVNNRSIPLTNRLKHQSDP
jgi:hypothetical protein